MSLFMVMSMLKYVNYVGRGHHSGGGQQHQRGQQSGRQHQDGEGQVFMAVKKTAVEEVIMVEEDKVNDTKMVNSNNLVDNTKVV